MSNSVRRDYCVGVDGGGTKCRAVVFDHQNNNLGEATGGPANIAKYGESALQEIVATVTKAIMDAGLLPDKLASIQVSAGLAGAFLESSKTLLAEWQHPFADFVYTSDITTAILGAHNGQNGSTIITGTGSCGAVWQDNCLTQFGGYGFTLGDQASGAWLGKEAVVKGLLHADRLIQAPLLWQHILQFYQCRDAAEVVNILNLASPVEFARFAPSVFELAENCPVTRQIIQQGADYLDQLAVKIAVDTRLPFSMTGGLAQRWKSWLSPSVLNQCVESKHGPEWGAMYFARHVAPSIKAI